MKRNYRNEQVKNATCEELLFELLRRGKMHDAPCKIQFAMPHKICCVGIGANHTGDIVIDDLSYAELERLIARFNDL